MMNPADTNKLQVTTPGDREIVMTRAFRAPRERLFDAFTKPDLIQRWLLGPEGWSMPVCDVDLRVGGTFRYVWRNNTDGMEFGITGTFKEIARPDRIVHTERFEPQMHPGEAVITTTFTEENGITTVTLNNLYESREIRDIAIESGMESGVATSYDRLENILS
jgi:uncharacterized protein YndB with AHSA1/START domain